MEVDVIISGAGVSGLACALFCAKNGLDTVVLEEKSEKDYKQNRPVKIEKSIFTKYLNRAPYPGELDEEIKIFHLISPEGGKKISVPNNSTYSINLQKLKDSLLKEFKEAGGKIYFSVKRKKIKERYKKNIWTFKWKRFLYHKKFKSHVFVDASGIHSPYRQKYSVEKDLLSIRPEWICDSLNGEYRIKTDWGPLRANENYSIIGRHGLLSIQQYYYSKEYDKLVFVLGALRKTPLPIPVGIPVLKSELFAYLNAHDNETLLEKEGEIPLRHSALSMANSGFLMLGDAAFLINSQYASGVASALVSASLAAKTILYIFRNQMKFSFHNLHSYTHEYMMIRGKQMLETHAQMRFIMNFNRQEMERFFKKGFVQPSDIEKILSGQKRLQGLKTVFRKLYPILKDMKLSYKLARNYSRYQDFKKHLDEYPYFPSRDELILYSRETIRLLNKIYNPYEVNRNEAIKRK